MPQLPITYTKVYFLPPSQSFTQVGTDLNIFWNGGSLYFKTGAQGYDSSLYWRPPKNSMQITFDGQGKIKGHHQVIPRWAKNIMQTASSSRDQDKKK